MESSYGNLTLETGIIDRTTAPTVPISNENGMIVTILCFVSVSMLFLYNPKIGIISGVIMLWGLFWLQFLLIDLAYLIGITFVAVLFVWKVR